MARYVDVRPDDGELPEELVLSVGDVVRLSATGGRLTAGTAVELLGVLTEAVLGTDGSVLSPMGAPGVVLLRARTEGRAEADVVSGDPFGSPVTRHVTVRVQPAR